MELIKLQRSLKFTTDELKANRDGRMSESQTEKYKAPEFSPLVIVVLMGHAGFIGAILALLAIVTGNGALWIVTGIVMAAILLPFVLLRNEGNIKPALRGDVEAGKVKQACGLAILTEKKGRQIYYNLYIDGVNLQINASQAAAFTHEGAYCVYYLPRSLTLLSAEPML